MIDRIIAIYCICDDFLKAWSEEHWPNIKMTDAEAMTTFILAHTDFYGNIEKSRIFLQEHGYIPRMLGKSHLCRRLHRFDESIWQKLIILVTTYGRPWIVWMTPGNV